jgi:nitrite reductase/ring-hydroxylating ferredoxin subunit
LIYSKKSLLLLIIACLLLQMLSSCRDDDENSNIPLVEVNFTLIVDDPAYLNLKNVGGWVYVSGGSRGIILYRANNEEIRAYDRHCTFQPSNTCALVSVDANNITASDDCCGSSFILTDGTVSNPPAVQPLKQYSTDFDGTTLRVFN